MPVTADELNRSASICFPTLANKIGITPRKLLQEIKLIAFSDPANHSEIAEGGELRFKTFDEQGKKRRCIKSIKEKSVITESQDGKKTYKTSTVEYTLHDKIEALDMGMAIHGMKAAKKHELSGNVNFRPTLTPEDRKAEIQTLVEELKDSGYIIQAPAGPAKSRKAR